jgi:hypothetical protein
MRINPVSSAHTPLNRPQPKGNLPTQTQSPSEAQKGTGMTTSMDGCGNSLVMAAQMVEQLNEITANIIEKIIK